MIPARLRLAAGIASLAIVLAILALVACAVAPMLFKGWRAASVESGSMQPAVGRGDIVLYSNAPKDPVKPGAIITFVRDGQSITHRVVSVNPDGSYTTRGDANVAVDSDPVQPDAVVGVVRFVVPHLGLPRVWMHDGRWGTLVLALAAIVGLTAIAFDVLTRPRRKWHIVRKPSAAPEAVA